MAAAVEVRVTDPEVTAAQLLALVDGVSAQAPALPVNERSVLVSRTIDPCFADLAEPG